MTTELLETIKKTFNGVRRLKVQIRVHINYIKH